MKQLNLTLAVTLLSLAGGCGGGGGGGGDDDAAPRVVSNSPTDGATNVAINASVSATFSEDMDASSLQSSFTLKSAGVAVAGSLIASGKTATFWPAAHLAIDGSFTATISSEASSAAGVGLDAAQTWTFQSGSVVEPGQGVNLGQAGNFVILAKSGISTVPTSVITGDIGVSPAAASAITGFALTAAATNVFSTSPQVTGKVFAANFAPPTPSNMTTAVGDMELAFTDAAGRAPDATELGAGNIGGMTLAPGVYKWGTGLMIPTSITLAGDASAVWIFQVDQNLVMASGTQVVLSGGAQAKNVYWQVAGSVSLGTTAHLEGVILTQTSITLGTGASVTGRLLAQTAVTIDSSTVVAP